MQLTAIHRVSVVSLAVTYFGSSQSVTQVFLGFLEVLSNALINNSLLLSFGACHCLLPTSGLSQWSPVSLPGSLADSHWEHAPAQHPLQLSGHCSAPEHLEFFAAPDCLTACVSPELSGLTDTANRHHHAGSRIILPFLVIRLSFSADILSSGFQYQLCC